jgi:DNA adenine methylase
MARFFTLTRRIFRQTWDTTARNFENLLITLSDIKSKFLLSSYPSELLAQYAAQNRWHSVELAGSISVTTNRTSFKKAKTEVLTANYPIS